jgi:glyoxylase-like metal-dependent hydrolase (beta-lactamase superfamily II)
VHDDEGLAARPCFENPLPDPGIPGHLTEEVCLCIPHLWEEICLIDTGVAPAADLILGYIRNSGRKPEEISVIVQTHAHPDHIGCTKAIQEASGCVVAAHPDERAWIEDVQLQARERPVPGFHTLVGGSASVDLLLADGDHIDLGDCLSLGVIHTPGHSPGSISLLLEEDAALFAGDAIPLSGQIPIFSDLPASIRSLERLKKVPGIGILLSSWDDPVRGDTVYRRMDEGLAYLEKIRDVVKSAAAHKSTRDPLIITKTILGDLCLSESDMNPLVVRSIEAAKNDSFFLFSPFFPPG